MRPNRIFPVVLAAVAVGVPALAAEPESGTVSAGSPHVQWKGETIMGGATTIPALANGGTVTCQAPSCDTFALKVADSDDLTVTATSDNGRVFVLLEVVKPDGSVVYSSGAEEESSTTIKIKKAPAGDYQVRVANNSIEPEPYTATATLGTRTAAPPPVTPGSPPGPAVTPAPTAQPSPSAQPSATLSVRTRKLSARKARRKPKLAISTTSPVTDVTATLKRGARRLGTGRLARLEKTGTIVVKLKRKLKPGRYTVALAARDSAGRAVGATAKLRVVR